MTELELKDGKERLMEVFNSPQYQPLKIKELAILLGIPKEQRPFLEEVLSELLTERKIQVTSHGKYYSVKNIKAAVEAEHTIRGVFQATQKGFGFVCVEGEEQDIFIAAEDTGNAFHNDEVEIVLKNDKSSRNKGMTEGKRPEGRVVKILSRASNHMVGLFVQTKHFAFVIPDDQKFSKDIFIDETNFHGAVDGHKVVVELLNYGEHGKNPEGKVIEILGHKNDPGVDILSIVRAYGIPTEYPDEVKKQLATVPEYVPEEDKQGRKDFRDALTVTIDGDDAKDLDDAISLVKTENEQYILGVHIADVTNYVTENSPLDEEARKRGTSVYLVDRVIPMLPHQLSNGICSLNEGVDRLALSCIMTIDEKGNVIDHEIAETLIRVDRRMTYHVVAELLNENCEETLLKEYSEFLEMFQQMRDLSSIIREKRRERGAIDFDFPEAKVLLDEKGRPRDIIPYERNVATKIIEDFMLTANETIAEAFYWQHIPFLYRNHEAPDEEKMIRFASFLGGFGHTLHLSNNEVHPKKLQKLLDDMEGTPEHTIVSRVMLRSMKQARYSAESIGHFGLASRYYTHFTSPIRRYPDLQIHRIIKEFLHDMKVREEHFDQLLPQVADTSSKAERRAEEVEREVLKRKKAQYMVRHIGEEYEGVISGVTSFGIFVELPNTVEGMVRLNEMQDDYYVYDEAHYRVVGDMKRLSYSLGQHVKVLVNDVDIELSTVSFRMLSQGEKQGGVIYAAGKKGKKALIPSDHKKPKSKGRGQKSRK